MAVLCFACFSKLALTRTLPSFWFEDAKRAVRSNCAARNCFLILSGPQDTHSWIFGADIEIRVGAEGRTSLLHAALGMTNINFAVSLLGYGANINATSIYNRTTPPPFTTAFTHNKPQCLSSSFYSIRWREYEYSTRTCPRLKGVQKIHFCSDLPRS